jgi:hypothetical protein
MQQEVRTRRVPYTTCRQVCETRMVTKTKCIPRQIVETKIICVPRTVCRQVPVQTCCNNDPCVGGGVAVPGCTSCGK